MLPHVLLVFVSLQSHASTLSSCESPLVHARAIATPGLRWVQIDNDKIVSVARQIAGSDYRIQTATWDMPPYPDASFTFNQMFEYFLVLNSINYMYMDPATGQTFGEGNSRGAARLAELLTQNWAKLNVPGALAEITTEQAETLFRSEAPLPDMPSRARALRAVGTFLDQHRHADWSKWLESFPRALDLADFVTRNIAGYEDPFVKRAQLFTGMLVGRFYARQELPNNMRRLEGMTVYADYILPMVLERLGILNYHPQLKAQINQTIPIVANSRQEVEIRATTLLASERLRRALNKTPKYRKNLVSILALDAALWLQGGEIEFPGSKMSSEIFVREPSPHHITMTSNY